MTHSIRTLLIILTFLISFETQCYQFNTKQIINTTSKNELQLEDDEGYLLLALDTAEEIDSLILKSDKFGGNLNFREVQPGQNFALIKLKAATYNWDAFIYYGKKARVRFTYAKDKHHFLVEPGVINYPGSWKSQLKYTHSMKVYHFISKNNVLAGELDNFKNLNQQLFTKYNIKYQGKFEDRFFTYYKDHKLRAKEFEKTTENTVNYKVEDGISEKLSQFPQIKDYLAENKQSTGEFSPDGSYLLIFTEIKGISLINVLNLKTFDIVKIMQQKLPENSYISKVRWVDNDTVYYNVMYDGLYNKRVAHLKIDNAGNIIGASHLKIDKPGRLLDPLIHQENKLYMVSTSIYSKKKNGIYLLDVSNEKSITKSSKKPYTKVKKLQDAVYFLTDSNDDIRFIITSDTKKDDTIYEYWFLNDSSDWVKIYEINDNNEKDPPLPILISKNNDELYVLTNEFSDKKAIHKYSTKDFSHLGVYYENEDIEITNLYVNHSTHDILGVRHIQNGIPVTKYFENSNDDLLPLREKYPSHHFYTIQQNKDINKVLVFGVNEYSKGSWSIYDTKTGVIDKLFETNPQYTNLEKGVFHTEKIKSDDGYEIEGYLVMPKKSAKSPVPLVVMPHGGPIGVRDYAIDNDVQHFFASQGIATLKVNYRGSGGFGKEFMKSGQKQWGEKIESDIFQMTNHVIEKYNITKNKICSMGASYGGYSSLMLSILYPDTYQCAVSAAGVTDLPLMFSSGDTKNFESGLSAWKKIIGDPDEDFEKLVNKSPVYLAEKITKPVFLVHGVDDERVTIEHSYRLKKILDLLGKESKFITLNDEGHSFSHINSEIFDIVESVEFIQKVLGQIK